RRAVPGALRPPARHRAGALPRRARRPRLLGARREERDLGDLHALGAGREAGDPHQVVAVAVALEAEALALAGDGPAGDLLPAADLLRRAGAVGHADLRLPAGIGRVDGDRARADARVGVDVDADAVLAEVGGAVALGRPVGAGVPVDGQRRLAVVLLVVARRVEGGRR